MHDDDVDAVFKYINGAWPVRPLTVDTMAVWGAALCDHEATAVMGVLQNLAQTEEWRPSLAQILAPLAPDSEVKSAEAAFETVWGQLDERPRTVSDLEERAVKRLGGWDVIGKWPLDKRHFHLRTFREVYDDLVDSGRATELRAIAGGQKALVAP